MNRAINPKDFCDCGVYLTVNTQSFDSKAAGLQKCRRCETKLTWLEAGPACPFGEAANKWLKSERR